MQTVRHTHETILGNTPHLTKIALWIVIQMYRLQNMIFRDVRFIYVEKEIQSVETLDRELNTGTIVKYNKDGNMIVAPEMINGEGPVLQVFEKQDDDSWSNSTVGERGGVVDFTEEVKYVELALLVMIL